MKNQNWKTYKLGEVVDLKQGLAINKGTNHLLCEEGQNSIPLFKIRDLLNNTVEHYVKADEVPKQCIAIETDLIYSRTGQVGHVFKGKIGCIHNNCFKVIPDNRLHREFLYHFLANPAIRKHANEIASGSVQKDLNHGAFKSIEIKFPDSIKEQRAIASILSALDDKIENNLAMNKTLEDMAMALYKHWFVDFGPFQDGKFIDSELGEIPEGWEVKQIKEIATVNSKSIKKGTAPERITYIDIASANIGSVSEVESMLFSNAPSRARRIIDDGDVVWSTVRPNRKSRFLSLGFEKDTIVSTGFAVISPKVVPYSYLYPHCCTDDFTDYLVSRATGSSYPAVTGKIFEEALILYPPELILSDYDKLAKPYYQSFASNNIENQTLTKLRDTLLPKLISGEVRLKEFEEEIIAAL